VKMLCIYADYKSDESYTPSKISVRVGNNFHNLQEIRVPTTTVVVVVYRPCLHPLTLLLLSPLQQLEMVEPSGWIHISLMNQVSDARLSFILNVTFKLKYT